MNRPGLTALFLFASIGVALGQEVAFPPQDRSGKRRAVFWEVERTPQVHPKSSWFGYPLQRTSPVEREVEKRVNAIRKKHGLVELAAYEELRFLGRLHAREWDALRIQGAHESKLWGHVSDRAKVLYGWRPTEWVLSPAPTPGTHAICDNFRGGGSDAEGYVDAWMKSDGHRRAILWKDNRQVGMAMSASGMAHLMFGGIPTPTLRRLDALQPVYAKLAEAEKASKVKKLLGMIVKAKEGSSFLRIAPLLFDADEKVRGYALQALAKLYSLVPRAKGVIFAIVDLALPSPDEKLAKKALKIVRKLTGKKLETAAEYQTWWHTDAHKRLLRR